MTTSSAGSRTIASDLSENPFQGLPERFDLAAFRRDIEALQQRAVEGLGEPDIRHLKKIERRGRICTLLGYATLWTFPNPLTAFLLSFGHFTRWLLAHHILHRGYDKTPGIPAKYTSKVFARGWRRFIDWFDWIHPDAWHHEHNILHHYHTGEDKDPDLVERHVQFIHDAPVPKWVKYLLVGLAGLTWRYTYYAPNTISVVDPDKTSRSVKGDHVVFITIKNIFDLRNRHVRKLWTACYLPYGLTHFVAIPLLFLPFGSTVALYALGNKLLAESILNLHSFFVIGPNHTGSDLYRFDYHIKDKDEFLVHQVLGSVEYATGGDLRDHLQIWLNYQVEHHLFPDLPMSKYQEIQPEVRRICEKHGLPYIQEPVRTRFRKMVDVCVGNAKMKVVKEFPFKPVRA